MADPESGLVVPLGRVQGRLEVFRELETAAEYVRRPRGRSTAGQDTAKTKHRERERGNYHRGMNITSKILETIIQVVETPPFA